MEHRSAEGLDKILRRRHDYRSMLRSISESEKSKTSELSDLKTNLVKQNAQREGKLVELQSEFDMHSANVRTAEACRNNLDKAIVQSHEHLESRERLNGDLNESLSEKLCDLESETSTKVDLKRQNSELLVEITALVGKIRVAEGMKHEKEETKIDMDDKLKRSEEARDFVVNHFHDTQSGFESSQKASERTVVQIEETRQEIQNFAKGEHDKILAVTTRATRIATIAETSSNECKNAAKVSSKLNSTLQAKRVERAGLEMKLTAAKSKLDSVKRTIERVEQQISDKIVEVDEMTKQRDATKDELVRIKKTIFQKNDEKAKCQLDAENAMKKLNMRKMESDLQLKQTKNKNTVLAKNLATRKKQTGQLDHQHKKDVKDHEERVREVIRRHEQFMERKEIAIKKQNSFIDSHEETREKNLKILKKAAEALVEVNKSKMEAHKHVRELEREGLKYTDVLKKAKSSAKEKQTMLDECKLKLATRRCRLEEESLELASLKGEEQHLKSSYMQLLAQLSELKRRERLRISRKVDGCVQVCIRGVDVGVNTMVDESMFSKFLTNPVLRPHKLNFPSPEWYESPIMLEAPESCHTTGRLVPESVQHTGEMSRDYGLSTDKMSPEYGQITGERQRSPEYGQSTEERSPEYGQFTGVLTDIDEEDVAGAL
eukprot:2395_1